MTDLRYELSKKVEMFWHAFPRYLGKRVRYWVVVYEGARHIRSNELVPGVTFMDVMCRSGDAAYRRSR